MGVSRLLSFYLACAVVAGLSACSQGGRPGEGGVSSPPAADPAMASEPAAVEPTAALYGAEMDSRTRIETLLGDAAHYEQVFKALQQGIAAQDRVAVAALMRYPLRVETDGRVRDIADADAFQRAYDTIIIPSVANAVAAQSFDMVFANWQGVMIGNGQVWLNGQCEDVACTRSDVKVVTIQQ